MRNDFVTAMRGAIADRATYLYMIYKALERDGRVDPETLLRGAIYEYGLVKGRANPIKTVREWIKGGSSQEILQKEYLEAEEDRGRIRFTHCPHLEAWRKLGATDEECATLCDIAMRGDYGEMTIYGFKMEVIKSLAKGDECCELVVLR